VVGCKRGFLFKAFWKTKPPNNYTASISQHVEHREDAQCLGVMALANRTPSDNYYNARLSIAYRPSEAETIEILFKNSVRTAKKTPHFTITNFNWLTLFKEMTAVYNENHTKPINTRKFTDC
jgi:hypothetical protein